VLLGAWFTALFSVRFGVAAAYALLFALESLSLFQPLRGSASELRLVLVLGDSSWRLSGRAMAFRGRLGSAVRFRSRLLELFLLFLILLLFRHGDLLCHYYSSNRCAGEEEE
jgi:hypothetical protein